MKRVLHLVRTTLPPGVAGPEDLVVYTSESARHAAVPSPPPAHTRIWDPNDNKADDKTDRPADPAPGHITSADLCRLCFELDTVAVW